MATTLTRVGRPSSVALAQRQREERQHLALLLAQALQHLNHPSRLSDSPLCELEGVRLRAKSLQGYRFPRAHVVIDAVRQAHEEAWQELGETADAPCLIALGDALAGLTRAASAQQAGVSRTEISRRRREAVEIILDRVLERIQED